MKKNGLNVEHFRYHITINYDKSASACIDQSKLRPNYVLVRPTEKVSRTSLTSGKNESRALIYIYISGLTDLSWSVIHKGQAPRFGTHVILGFISKCNHNRVKVYNLFLFTQANFKQFQGEKAKGNSICYSCAILYAHSRTYVKRAHAERGAFQTAREHQTKSSEQTHTHKIMTKYHLENHLGKRSQLCLKWMKTAQKEIRCVSLYWIHASGLKGTAAYKCLLLSLMLIKQQNSFDKDLDLIYTVNTMQCYFSLIITFLYLNTIDLILFVTYSVVFI